MLEAFRASVSHDVSEYAARIPERTLLIAAEKDDITPVAAEYRLQTLFPDARLRRDRRTSATSSTTRPPARPPRRSTALPGARERDA